jgi:transcriptional regulator with XRE-family HTH domain
MNSETEQPLTLDMLRTRSGLTQRQVADLLGVTVSTVSNWERGVQVPRLTFFQTKRLMEATDSTIDELVSAFTGTQSQQKKEGQ